MFYSLKIDHLPYYYVIITDYEDIVYSVWVITKKKFFRFRIPSKKIFFFTPLNNFIEL